MILRVVGHAKYCISMVLGCILGHVQVDSLKLLVIHVVIQHIKASRYMRIIRVL